MEPLISVIIPIYNVECYLRECIDSLLQQEFRDFELVLVDDGSPDNCPLICDEYAKKYNNIKVVHKENGGLVSARKAGAKQASGKYIANLDGDDWVTSDFFTTIAKCITDYMPDVIQLNTLDVFPSRIIENPSRFSAGLYTKADLIEKIYPLLIEDEFGRDYIPSICCHIFKAELYKKYQEAVNNDIKIGEDAACTKPLILKSQNIYVLNKAIYCYRQNDLSMTKCRKPFDLGFPKKVGIYLEKNISDNNYNIKLQICRYVTHNLFNACSSAFYSNEPYCVIKRKIKETLKDEYYQNAIKNCKYNKKYLKGQLVRFALKYRLYFLMKIYCKYGNKAW